jgi:hypothetical protein
MAVEAFRRIGVQKKHFKALACVLFDEESRPGEVKQIAFEEFVNKIVKLRPDKPSSVLDIAELRYCLQSDVRHNNGIHQRTLKHVFNHQDVMEEKAEVLATTLERLSKRMDRIEADLDGGQSVGQPAAGQPSTVTRVNTRLDEGWVSSQ